jgi:hypothetical protein
MEKNDDEQEQFVPGPAQSGSGEVFAFHIEEINNSCRGRILPTFVLGGDFDLQTLVTILLGGGISPQKHYGHRVCRVCPCFVCRAIFLTYFAFD